MKRLLKNLSFVTCIFLIAFILATISSSAYSNHVLHKADEPVLTDCKIQTAHKLNKLIFVCNISMRPHFMAKLERDTFECAGNRLNLSVNPFQLCHHQLTVIGKAPKKSNGA